MRSDKIQSGMTTRQKVIAGVFVLILLFIVYQIYGLFGRSTVTPTPTAKVPAEGKVGPTATTPQPGNPQPASLPKQNILSPREAELVRLQQETQAKYVEALNALQMLKVERDIAEANKAIMAAKLDTINSQKNILMVLGAGFPSGGGPSQANQPPSNPPPPPVAVIEVNYSVVSVSQIQRKWSAVLGYQGNLYNVSIGDILPPDRSTVVSISKSGVTLERNGARKRISLVPVI